jgi:RND family efflux transporter MFP subunit
MRPSFLRSALMLAHVNQPAKLWTHAAKHWVRGKELVQKGLQGAGAVGLVLVALLAGCSRPAPPQEPPRAVKLLTVGVGSLQAQHEYAGDVRARVESQLAFRVPGKLVQRHVRLGQRVQAGEVLAQLDPQDFQLATEQARAQVMAAQTQRDLARADYQRFATLKDQNFISGAELERREATLKAAQAALDQAKAQLATQGNQAQYTRLVTEVSGVVTGIDAEPGQVVSAGTPVVRIAQDGARDVVFAVPEDKVQRMRVGQVVSVRGWSEGAVIEAHVRELAASADPVTRTYTVKVSIAAAESPPLGATVYATPAGLSDAGQPAIKLPTTALRQEGNATSVWVFDAASSTVHAQVVQIATADGNEAVIAQGLKPGMQVVSTGVHVLTEGQKVTIYEQKQHSASEKQAPYAIKSIANSAGEEASIALPSAAASRKVQP